jgi:uncharacterized protein
MDALVVQSREGTLLLRVRVSPGASRAQIKGVHGGALKLSVTEPPEHGRANEGVLRLLADALGVPARQIALVSGAASRDKRFEISGLRADELAARLGLEVAIE